MARGEHPLTSDERVSALVDEVNAHGQPIVLTRDGEGVAVILTMAQFRALSAAQESSLALAVLDAESDVASGRWSAHEEIAKRLKTRAGHVD